MNRLFYSASGFKAIAGGGVEAVRNIGIVVLSENSLKTALKVIENVKNLRLYSEYSPLFNLNFNAGIVLFAKFPRSGKSGLFPAAKNYAAEIENSLKKSSLNLNGQVSGGVLSGVSVERFEKFSPDFTESLFDRFDFILFFLAVGAAVRLIAPHVRSKLSDPAVTVVDEAGRFAVSLLSGHIGGANRFTEYVAASIGAIPVITTATDASGKFSLDTFADDFDFFIEDARHKIKEFNSASLRGEEFVFYVGGGFYGKEAHERLCGMIKEYLGAFAIRSDSQADEVSNNNRFRYRIITKPSELDAFMKSAGDLGGKTSLIVISPSFQFNRVNSENFADAVNPPLNLQTVILKPKNIVLGIGCNKGTSFDEIEEFAVSVLDGRGISLNCIKNIATIDLKKDEEGILKFGLKYGKFIDFFSKDDINNFLSNFLGKTGKNLLNPVCFKHTGAYSVAEPCALMSSKSEKLIISKKKKGNVTISAAVSE